MFSVSYYDDRARSSSEQQYNQLVFSAMKRSVVGKKAEVLGAEVMVRTLDSLVSTAL